MREPATKPAPEPPIASQGDGLADLALRATGNHGVPDDVSVSCLEPGALIAGRYRLVKPIGKGGMAEVWRATHEELRTDVAVKFLSPALWHNPEMAPLALGRFRFEAQASAQLSSKTRHIVSVMDAGSHRGIPYLTMELVLGHDLEQEVAQNGPLAPLQVAALLDQVADALDIAHAMGIVHRDIKPSNILLARGASGEMLAKVADFGVAKSTLASGNFDLPRATMQGLLVGSPAYMSPEQANANSSLRGTSDIWSLGVVVYEALTGKTCFDGKNLPELLVAVSTRKLIPMSQIRPGLGKALDRWLDRCLALDPSGRFQTVAEMSRAFREAMPAFGAAAVRGRSRAHHGRTALVAVLGALVAAALFGIVYFGATRTSAAPSDTAGSSPSTAAVSPPSAAPSAAPAASGATPDAPPAGAALDAPTTFATTSTPPATSPPLRAPSATKRPTQGSNPTKILPPSEIH